MPSIEVLPLERILGPIAGDNPAGRDLRQPGEGSEVFDTLKEAQAEARRAEKRELTDGNLPREPNSEWRRVLDLSRTALENHSKDLQIAAWMIEALVRFHGFAGLRDGFRCARSLMETYWDALYPPGEADGFESRVAYFWGLNGTEGREGTIILPIRLVRLGQGGNGVITLLDYSERPDAEEVRKAIEKTPAQTLRNLREDAASALDELGLLQSAFARHCPSEAPPVGNIREALQHALEIVRGATKHIPDEDAGGGAGGSGGTDGSAAGPASLQGAIRNRAHALEILDRLAVYFRDHDPHSFVSYHVERAARWGRTPLPELLKELLTDESERERVLKHVGIPMPRKVEEGGSN